MAMCVIKTQDKPYDGCIRREVCGLNLLPDDHPLNGTIQDPRIIFLRQLAVDNRVSAIFDRDMLVLENLGSLIASHASEVVPVCVVGGEILHSDVPESLFFPQIESGLFDMTEVDDHGKVNSLMFNILYADAMPLFVSPRSTDAPTQIATKLSEPFRSTGEFLRRAVQFYEVIVTSQADGDFFDCFAETETGFKVLEQPLAAAVERVEQTPWFQDVRDELVWDNLSMCWVEKSQKAPE